MNIKRRPPSINNRQKAIWAGLFYILATIAPIMTYPFIGFLMGELPVEILAQIAANEYQVIVGGLIELTYALAVIGIIATLHPILKMHRPALSLGFFSLRLLEAVFVLFHCLLLFCLLSLSQIANAGVEEVFNFQTAGRLVLAVREWTFLIGSGIVWSLSALVLNTILYQVRLLPRWISGWGLIGSTLSFITYALQFFNIALPELVYLPIGIQEMVFAAWLIARGLNAHVKK
jgi:hypothetical protein